MTQKKSLTQKLVDRLAKKISNDEATALAIYAGCEMEVRIQEKGEKTEFVYGTKYPISIEPDLENKKVIVREGRPEGLKTIILEVK